MPLDLVSQEAFDCDGTAFISLVEDGTTTFYEVSVGDQDILQTPISSGFDANINAIGFNRLDSLIYGINPETNQLFRIGADGILEGLVYLPLQGNYYAGDIHPNGNQLILLNGDSLAIVNLQTAETPITYIPISTLSEEGVLTTDIAYHPLTQVLYGFDGIKGKLISINDNTGVVDNTSFPEIGYKNSLPAMFFDAKGELYGLGTNNISITELADEKSILFHFDIKTGEARQSTFEGNVGERDGCSCPFTVKLFQKLSNEYLIPCSTIELVLTISNLTGETLEQYQLTQDLPEGYLIEEIVYNPFPSVSPLNLGTNKLSLSDMRIEHGIDSIKFLVSVPESAAGDSHFIQATLNGQNANPLNSYLSDDAVLAEKNDPTWISIRTIEDILNPIIPEEVELCAEDTFTLNLPLIAEFEYIWSDSFQGNQRRFGETASPSLQINTPCSSSTFDINIIETNFTISLGDDIEIKQGDFATLSAEAFSLTEVVDYDWKTIDGDIGCINCSSIQVRPSEDTKYILIAENETGCITSEEINVFVSREVYIPNVFSPNGDGINDLFYIHSGNPGIPIRKFKIYNRWGEQVFESNETTTNNENFGWDGRHKGKPASNGTYIWTANISFNDKREVFIQGQFVLNR